MTIETHDGKKFELPLMKGIMFLVGIIIVGSTSLQPDASMWHCIAAIIYFLGGITLILVPFLTKD